MGSRLHRGESTPDDGAGGVSSATELSTEAVFETLSSRRRRYTLHYLKQRDAPVTIRDLSEQVAAWENGTDRSDVSAKDRKRVYTALHQTHLPKMHKLGVVVYDRDRGTIELTGSVREFDIYLEVVPATNLPWGQFYLGLGAVLTAVTAVAALGVFPFSLVDGFGYALFAALALTAIGAYHTYRERRSRIGASDTPQHVVPPAESRESRRTTARDD